jgi:hypothetical protein
MAFSAHTIKVEFASTSMLAENSVLETDPKKWATRFPGGTDNLIS